MELTPLEIMEYQDEDFIPSHVDLRDSYEYILKASIDDTNLYKCLKANIICSRRVYEDDADFNNFKDWDIGIFRNIIYKAKNEILTELDSRWKISILECFSYDGTCDEKLISSLISQLNHMTHPLMNFLNSVVHNEQNIMLHVHDIVKIVVRIKSIIPLCDKIGFLALDILREIYEEEYGMFMTLHQAATEDEINYVNYLIYSDEFDVNKLYRMYHEYVIK